MQRSAWEKSRLILSLLDTIGDQGEQSQRAMADRFGVALGHVNGCLRNCVRKGYVTVRRLPPRRFVYALTPEGEAERLRLRLLILSKDLNSFRQARFDYRAVCEGASAAGWTRIVLLGASELAEISALCAFEAGLEIVAVIDADMAGGHFLGVPVLRDLESMTEPCDGMLLTDVRDCQGIYAAAVRAVGTERVRSPAFLGLGQARAA